VIREGIQDMGDALLNALMNTADRVECLLHPCAHLFVAPELLTSDSHEFRKQMHDSTILKIPRTASYILPTVCFGLQ